MGANRPALSARAPGAASPISRLAPRFQAEGWEQRANRCDVWESGAVHSTFLMISPLRRSLPWVSAALNW